MSVERNMGAPLGWIGCPWSNPRPAESLRRGCHRGGPFSTFGSLATESHSDREAARSGQSVERASGRHGEGGLILVRGDPKDTCFEVGPGTLCRVDLRTAG